MAFTGDARLGAALAHALVAEPSSRIDVNQLREQLAALR